jgi:hypothetical protein
VCSFKSVGIIFFAEEMYSKMCWNSELIQTVSSLKTHLLRPVLDDAYLNDL